MSLSDEEIKDLAKLTAKQIYTQGYVAGELATQTATWNAALEKAVELARAMQSTDQLKKDIWNEAIEAAVLRAERSFQNGLIAEAIKKLKK